MILNLEKMRPPFFYFLSIGILILTSFTEGTTPKDILRQAELKRSPWNEMSFVAQLSTKNDGKESKNMYKVYLKDEIKTLVAFLEPKFEKGNLLLMVEEELWFYVKETKRPTRITPIQRLSGSVSYGDIARLGWTKDYNINQSTETTLDVGNEKKAAYQMNLSALSKGATYQKITLWIDKANSRPIIAEVYLLSGKLYKTLKFTKFENIAGKDVNTEIVFTDHTNKDKESVLVFNKITQEKNLPNRYYVKTSLPEVSDEIAK